ncbi:MAG: AAA family ATPase, partial [Spirochaetales bacterium]|nr:AAA family ATPase [Spirochaetales bacterium]
MLTLDLINDRNATLSDFTEFDSASGRIIPLLYQSGYITIKSYNREFDYYTLGFPNQEVEKGFLDTLLPYFVNTNGESMGMEVKNIQKAIISNDVDGLMTIISSLVADIPTMIKKDMYENYYLSIMHMIFRLAGFTVMSELQSIYG